MRVLVSGDREWTDRDALFTVLDTLHRWRPFTVVVEGCARGADSLAEEWGDSRGVTVEHHPADWRGKGRAAGPIRNQEMLDTGVDLVIAFHPNLSLSKGTGDMVRRSRKAGVPVLTYPPGR